MTAEETRVELSRLSELGRQNPHWAWAISVQMAQVIMLASQVRAKFQNLTDRSEDDTRQRPDDPAPD